MHTFACCKLKVPNAYRTRFLNCPEVEMHRQNSLKNEKCKKWEITKNAVR